MHLGNINHVPIGSSLQPHLAIITPKEKRLRQEGAEGALLSEMLEKGPWLAAAAIITGYTVGLTDNPPEQAGWRGGSGCVSQCQT